MSKQNSPLVLGTERISKLLTQYAIPAIIAMTASSLYNMADSIFIGHGVGPLAISGLALTFPLMNLVTSWKDIYPDSRLKDISVVFDNPNSSTVRFATDSICGGKSLSTTNVKALRTNQQVINYVAQTPDAIGVIGVNWLGNRSDTTNLSFRDEVRVMSVSAEDIATPENSYKPYQAYLYYGDYPLARPIYILLNDPRSTLPWGFASFLTSDRGQRIILKSGLVPATQPVRIVSVKDE